MNHKLLQTWAGRIGLIILAVPVVFFGALSLKKAQLGKKEHPFGPQFSWVATPVSTPTPFPTPFPTLIPTPTPPPGLNQAENDLHAKDAVNCGNVSAWVPKKRAPADACAVAALKAKKPFQLRYSTYTRNNMFNVTLIGNRKGYVYFVSSNVECCGDLTPFVYYYLCKQPIIVAINGKRRIACKNKRNLTP